MKYLLECAIRKREPLRALTNALRLVNSTGDGLEGLIVEQYHKHFVAQVFGGHWLKETFKLVDFLRANFEVEYLIIKDRTATSSANPSAINVQVLVGDGSPSTTVVEEYGIRFAVDLNDGLNTGLFLDMRATRNWVGSFAKDRRLLNCFAYTCSFGVHARRAGAKEVVNVDISKKILDCGRHNYELNGIVPSGHEFIRGDVAAYIERAVKKGNFFDVIVLDPPSFARTDTGLFRVQKDLPRLVASARAILNPGGALLVSTNFNGITYEDLKHMLPASKKFTKIGQGLDFPGTNTFKESYLVGLWAIQT